MSKIRVAHVGLGPIGAAILRQLAARRDILIVGAVDVDPAKVGRDVGEVAEVGRGLRVPVGHDITTVLRASRPDIVVHCTGSSLKAVAPQIECVLANRTPVVSTTEELSYPTAARVRVAARIDALARAMGVAALATGVNPGFAMDALPIALTAVCARVDRVRVARVQDARIRRLPFQQKIGAGLTRREFAARVRSQSVRHVGLAESIAMIADALNWRLDRTTDVVRPKIATRAVASRFIRIRPGQVCGLVQDGVGYRRGVAVIRLHMEAYLGAPDTYDEVVISGSPRLHLKIDGGIHGDTATASIVVNSIPRVLAAAPGLHTMRDLPLPSFFPER